MNDNQKLKNKKDELLSKITSLNSQEKGNLEKLDSFEAENKGLTKSNNELKSKITELNLKEKEYKAKLNDLEKVFENLQKKIDVVQAEKSKKTEEDTLNVSKEVENLQKKNVNLE